MSPEQLAASLRRVCEIADIAAQNGIAFDLGDEQHLKRIEAVADVLYRRTDPQPVQTERRKRLIVLDTPEDTEAVDMLVEAATPIPEYECSTCHDTKRVMRKDRHGNLVQTTKLCPACALPVSEPETDPWDIGDDFEAAGITSAEQARRVAEALLRGGVRRPLDDEGVLIDGAIVRVGDRLNTDQRNYLRAASQNGVDRMRLLAREILDAEPQRRTPVVPVTPPDVGVDPEVWNFGRRGGFGSVPTVVALGQRMDLWQFRAIRDVAQSTDHSYADAQIEKAQRFLNAMNPRNRAALEREDRDDRARTAF